MNDVKATLRNRGLAYVTDARAYEVAADDFARGGSRRELIERLIAIGMASDDIRYMADFPGRRLTVVSF